LNILSVNNLRTYFNTDDGLAKAVDGISFNLKKGEILGIVGESGCGKSVAALSILRLLPESNSEIKSGEIIFQNKNLLSLSEKEIQKIRGNKISMIFQEPMTSLNPVYKCGNQLIEVFKIHQNCKKEEAIEKSIQLLKKVGVSSPEKRMNEYPHQLSGGLRQRITIAMALACKPDILIADEPTTALDVTVQSQILELLSNLQKEFQMSIILITHDLGVIAQTCDRVIVMYASKIVEEAQTKELFENPKHPYTIGLLKSIPDINYVADKLFSIKGTVPSALNYPLGCRFNTRCEIADDICFEKEPPNKNFSETHFANCFKI